MAFSAWRGGEGGEEKRREKKEAGLVSGGSKARLYRSHERREGGRGKRGGGDKRIWPEE